MNGGKGVTVSAAKIELNWGGNAMPGMPAAKEGDTVFAIDMHLIQPPGPTSPVVVPHPFTGTLDGELSSDVKIEGMAAATKGSTATNSPSHVPLGGRFVNPPQHPATEAVRTTTRQKN